jgi:hypothetical protein
MAHINWCDDERGISRLQPLKVAASGYTRLLVQVNEACDGDLRQGGRGIRICFLRTLTEHFTEHLPGLYGVLDLVFRAVESLIGDQMRFAASARGLPLSTLNRRRWRRLLR